MIQTIRVFESSQLVPYHNLAVEKYLLDLCGEGNVFCICGRTRGR